MQRRNVRYSLKSRWISTAVGLASIPLIIRPIDLTVEDAMDATFRKWTGYHPHHGEDEPTRSK